MRDANYSWTELMALDQSSGLSMNRERAAQAQVYYAGDLSFLIRWRTSVGHDICTSNT